MFGLTFEGVRRKEQFYYVINSVRMGLTGIPSFFFLSYCRLNDIATSVFKSYCYPRPPLSYVPISLPLFRLDSYWVQTKMGLRMPRRAWTWRKIQTSRVSQWGKPKSCWAESWSSSPWLGKWKQRKVEPCWSLSGILESMKTWLFLYILWKDDVHPSALKSWKSKRWIPFHTFHGEILFFSPEVPFSFLLEGIGFL